VIAMLLVAALLIEPSFITLTKNGHAFWLISIGAGLLVGILGQRARLCFAGGIRDLFIIKDSHLFQGMLAFFVFCFVMNLILGQFKPGAAPIAHSAHVANFLGMALVGLCAVLLGGCPFRQTIMAGYGNADSGMAFLGMLVGAGFAHNFGLTGKSTAGLVAAIAGIVFCLTLGLTSRARD
jgi:YedE family putative selenium metabolism protein